MLVLGPAELKEAEEVLKLLFPESIKVYGCLFNINRGKPHNLEVVADSWPGFSALVCKPMIKGTADREGEYNIYSVYSRDSQSLGNLLGAPGVIDWNVYTLIAGVDINHVGAVEELAVLNQVLSRRQAVMHVMTLTDSAHLNTQTSNSGCTLRPLTPDDADLVNSTWKYGGTENSLNSVQSYILHHPSLCVVRDGETVPVSWVLLYPHAALGLLYTRAEHRNRSYATLLVAAMARQLQQRGYPVYCFVEEGNGASCRLFSTLGFTHKPGYRAVWFELNER